MGHPQQVPGHVGVVFSIATAETQLGETLHVVGAGPFLGEWDPQHAVPLSTSPAAYPRWSSKVVWIPCPEGSSGVKVQYKFIRDARACGRGVQWEDRIENRSITLPPQAHVPASRANAGTKEGYSVWVTGDHAWDRQDAGAPRMLSAPKEFHRVEAPAHHGKLPPEISVEEDPPEVASGRGVSPEWGGDNGDDVISRGALGDINMSTFTPSARRGSCSQRTPSRSTPGMLSPASSTSMLQRHISTSLLPDPDASSEDESPVMVREESVSSLQGLCPQLVSSGSRSSSQGQLLRGRSASRLPEVEVHGGEGPIDTRRLSQGSASSICSIVGFEDAYVVADEQPIGEGSFGLVWNCRRKSGDQTIRAVKRISKARLQPRDVRNLFGDEGLEGEIRMHLRLKHNNIVEMHEVFDDVGIVSLVMECCRGGDLFDIITSHSAAYNRGLSERAAARILSHLLNALEFLHGLHIVHRDVKCENVLLLEQGIAVEKGTYKLCDFGFAAEQQTGPSGVARHLRSRLGSPDAVAPEVVRGDEYSTPVDIWAAGVLLFMALSATPPFWASTDIGVLQRVRAGNYNFCHERWKYVSPEAKGVVRKLLAFEPLDRVTAVKGLELPWVICNGAAERATMRAQ